MAAAEGVLKMKSIANNFQEDGAWRAGVLSRMGELSAWLHRNDLSSSEVEAQIEAVTDRVKDRRMVVAFVAEYSRGKSELINALFFSDMGRRIMPASAGRTTMCPTEIAYDETAPIGLKLLPIHTRSDARSLLEWRRQPESWVDISMDHQNPDGVAQAMFSVSDVIRVSEAEAKSLGFWQDDDVDSSVAVDEEGMLLIPKWRHALINFPHPMLKNGLVILDTPGLNAIGAEPELTISLLPQSHAILFVLGADTGVTKSDLKIWQDHLMPVSGSNAGKLVVLNKIDTLWDPLSTVEDNQRQIQKQVAESAKTLRLSEQQVFAVSAQKGLVARLNEDAEALRDSGLLEVESALVNGVLTSRENLLRDFLSSRLIALSNLIARGVQRRMRDLTDQFQELESLKGRNASVITHMRKRIEVERLDFQAGSVKVQAVRSVHLRLVKKLLQMLGHGRFRQEVLSLVEMLKQSGLKIGIAGHYEIAFLNLRALLNEAQATSVEIHNMLSASFDQMNADFGLSLRLPAHPDLSRFIKELDEIERSHAQYFKLTNLIKLSQSDFCDRLGRALSSRLRVVYESAANEVELWNKTAAGQLDEQIRSKTKNLSKRIEAVQRIEVAADGLESKMSELRDQLAQDEARLAECRKLCERVFAG